MMHILCGSVYVDIVCLWASLPELNKWMDGW